MELLREWQPERVAPLEAEADWVEAEAVLEVARLEAQPRVALLVAFPLVLPVVLPELDLDLALDAVLVPADRAVRPELARAEVEPAAVRPWGPTYRVIRRYPPPTEASELLVQVVAEARQQPWVRRTRPVRTVRRKQ